jgi:hypothetical protein
LTSAITPTTFIQGSLIPLSRTRLPNGDAPGQYRLAIVSLTIATGGAVAVSVSANGRPASSWTPIAVK